MMTKQVLGTQEIVLEQRLVLQPDRHSHPCRSDSPRAKKEKEKSANSESKSGTTMTPMQKDKKEA